MTRRWLTALCLGVVLSIGTAPLAVAAADSGAAARQAAQMTGGRVLDVQTGNAGGRMVYFVRVLLADGRVKVVRIDGGDARSGHR
jgi:uncharacterized membrane protein YkoI